MKFLSNLFAENFPSSPIFVRVDGVFIQLRYEVALMKYFVFVVVFLFSIIASASDLTKDQSVLLAEKFVLENGYTDAPPNFLKKKLDSESLKWEENREKLLKIRFSSLSKKAIGIKPGRRGKNQGWSVAFDFADYQDQSSCRVVTMNIDGSEIRLEHVEGKREHFVGF